MWSQVFDTTERFKKSKSGVITGIHCGSVAGCMKTTNVSGSASPFFFFACPLFGPLGNNHTNDSWISLWTRC